MPVSSILRRFGLGAFALWATMALAQSGSGNMMTMTVTMKMQVSGAGDLPARTTTQEVCTSTDHDMRAMLQHQQKCAVSDYRQLGSVVSYHLVCGGNPPTMTGDARFELLPNDDIRGSVHANSNMGGQSVVMDMTYAGRRTGSCDYGASRQRR